MTAKVKYRKCSDCGGKMMVRKSGKGNKFWGCTEYQNTGCRGSAEYHGAGARAGLNLAIREIENGFIITTASPYAGIDDDPVERHVQKHEELSPNLTELLTSQITVLCKEIKDSTEFVDEVDTKAHAKRRATVKRDRGTSDVGELLQKMKDKRVKEAEV